MFGPQLSAINPHKCDTNYFTASFKLVALTQETLATLIVAGGGGGGPEVEVNCRQAGSTSLLFISKLWNV